MNSACAALLIVCGTLGACARTETPPPRQPIPPPESVEQPASSSPTKSVVTIAKDIREACGINEADAHFAFDSAEITSADYPTLDKLVQCFTNGALAHREMRLVGHADPRGAEEYNLVLGGSRADGVKAFLVDRGLSPAQASTTSRGEMDAKGTSEPTWAEDRRVDILLAN